MFGFDPPNNPKPAKSNLEQKSLDYAKYKRH